MKAVQEAISEGPLLQTPSQRRPREPDDGTSTACFSNIPPKMFEARILTLALVQTLLKACRGLPANGPNWMFLLMSGICLVCPGGSWVISEATTAAEAMAPLTSTQTK